ncbi:hypothetical protein GRX03_03835 [Halovenus sp. WSH3]|uniref:Uncharacterized protein n=1 Tax=Halovenus carboxidivorans TaxID=2692199 RepID=A0A6B0T3G6_9EURY|nr:hypothetical protein [Halovenus carboxidivorans]MXR50736.1 hypothetical protein [Halovenus carboxidivorans]
MNERYENVLRFLRARGGDSLRTAFSYTDDEWTALYVREDVDTPELRRWLATYIENVREHDPVMPTDEYERLGETKATVEVHSEGVLIHFWLADSEGFVISMGSDVAQNLTEFVEQCQRRLHRREDGSHN